MTDYIIFGKPSIKKEEIDEVVDSLKSNWLGTGPKVKKFESDFSIYKKTSNSVALNSCTAGLHLSCIALNFKKGDEVITSAMTFCATVNSIIHSGATPVIADIDPLTWNIDPISIEEKITSRTKAIIPVHFAGRACDMDRIMQIAKKYNLYVIEDCAHAIETEYKGKKAGTIGDLGVFSFYATKNIVTGEGGMVISEKNNLISRIKTLGLHGMSNDAWKRFSDSGYKHYKVEEAGFKYNMLDIQASIGIHQLKKVEVYSKRRELIWDFYLREFSNYPISMASDVEENTKHAYHLFIIRVNKQKSGINRDDFLNKMHKKKIGCGVHYEAIPKHPFYKKSFDWNLADYKNSVRFGEETVSLPLSGTLTDNEVERITKAVKDIFDGS
mgnify:CR=1 FL=1